MTTQPTPTLESRIRATYDGLSAQERRLADLILASPGKMVTHRANEMSAEVDISKATATRFFRRLGYASFEQAREQVRKAHDAGSPLYMLDAGATRGSLEETIQAHLQNEVGNLMATYKSLDAAMVRTVARRIARARRIVLFGFRHGQGPAQALRRMLVHVRSDVQLLPLAGETLAEYLCNLGPKDLAISVDLRRRSAQMLPVARALAQMGTPLLYITDVVAGESAKLAQWVIRCHTGGAMLFDSTAGVGGVCNLLCSLAARELDQGNAAYLETIEALHLQLGELEA